MTTPIRPEANSRHIPVSDGVTLRVLTSPGYGKLPFLLVHGLASNARMWDGVAAALAAAGHEVAAVDLRGHGESTKVEDGFDWETLSQDLAAVADRLSWDSLIAAGQSWGGNVVLELAARGPQLVAAVALVDGGFLKLRDAFPDWEQAETALRPPRLNGVTISAMEAWMRTQDDGFPKSSIPGRLANFEIGPDGGIRNRLSLDNHMAILRHLWEHDPDTVARKVAAPIDLIAVESEQPGKPERVETFAGISDATVHWHEGHHDIHTQQPRLVADLLTTLAGRAS